MFVPGYRRDHDNKLYSCVEETQRRLVVKERKPSVAMWRHHPALAATVSGLGSTQHSASWGLGGVCCFLGARRFGAAAGPVSRLGEAECWFGGARSVVLQSRWRRAGPRRWGARAAGALQLPLAEDKLHCLVGTRPLGGSVRPQFWTSSLYRRAPSGTRPRLRGA